MPRKTEIHKKFKTIFNTPEGKDCLIHLAKLGFLHKTHFTNDPIHNALNEGQRRIVLEIFHLAQANIPDTIEELNQDEYRSIE